MFEKVDGSNKGTSMTPMDLWEKAIKENKAKNEERAGIMDRGQRTGKSDTENKVQEDYECKTCASRRYMDQSDDSSVSFQTPTHVPASQSTAAVAGHEMEHVRSEEARAQKENREVISSSVSIQYAICPECGRSYASGGETRTVTKAKQEEEDDDQNKQELKDPLKGKIVDSKA